jgi:hypothetical protein
MSVVEMQRRLTNRTSLFNKVEGSGGLEEKLLVGVYAGADGMGSLLL